MTRRLTLRRMMSESLESRKVLSADGLLDGECEHVESEQAETEYEYEHEHDSDSVGGDDSSSDDASQNGMELHARLSGDTSAHGEAEYESETEHGRTKQEFEVEIEDAEPGSTHDVSIDGVIVGQVVINEWGKGRLSLSSDPEDNDLPLPEDFPVVTPNSVVAVGSIAAGSFDGAGDSSTDDDSSDDSCDDVSDDHDDDGVNNGGNSDDSSGDDSENEESHELQAALRGETGAQGKAEFEVETEGGVTKSEFSVRVVAADPLTSYDVVVDGVLVGQVTTNELGNGVLKLADGDDSHPPLPADFPAIQPGSSVMVGTILSGTFRVDDHHSGDMNDDQQIDDHDIDDLYHAIAHSMSDDRYDLDGDDDVDDRDASYLIEVILGSVMGDANLDGVFDSDDLIEISAAGRYEDGIAGNGTWKTGDWNGDGDCDSRDLIDAVARGSYVHSAHAQKATDAADDSGPAERHDKRNRG